MRIWPSRRTVKRWGIGIAIVVGLLLIANGVMAWRFDRKLAAKIVAIRAAGDPASIADLKPVAIPDDKNAAAQIESLGLELFAFSKEHSDWLTHTEIGRAYDNDDDRGKLPSPEQAAAMCGNSGYAQAP